MIPQLKIFSENEKQEITKKLEKQFGIKEVPGMITMFGAERMFIFQGDLEYKELQNLRKAIVMERVGIYFAKEQAGEIRLTIDGVHLFKDQITKNILEINKEQLQEWLHGNELNIDTELRGFVVIKCENDFVGTGKASENKITNFIPKNRRLKLKN